MPFTPSHAVVALPFVRTPLVPAAIAIGAMTPDLPLFVRGFGMDYAFTHGALNAVWTALLALGLFLVWRVVLRPAAPELMPSTIARRLPAEWSQGGRIALRDALVGGGRLYPIWLGVSLILGVLSHIAWDLFTHEGRGGVQAVPLLAESWGPLPGFTWLQYGSSVVGAVVIAVWAVVRLRRSAPRPPVHAGVPRGVVLAWWLSLPVMLAAAWGGGMLVFGGFTEEFTAQHLAYRVLPPACALWGVLTLLLCLAVPLFRRGHQPG